MHCIQGRMRSAIILLIFFQLARWLIERKRTDNALPWKTKIFHWKTIVSCLNARFFFSAIDYHTIWFVGSFLGVILAWFASIKCSGRFVDGCCHRVLSDFVIQFFIKYGKNNYQWYATNGEAWLTSLQFWPRYSCSVIENLLNDKYFKSCAGAIEHSLERKKEAL